jgi:hypothetical protein
VKRQPSNRVWLIAAMVVAGCVPAAAPYNPFKMSAPEIRQKVKRVALAPVILPVDLDDPEPVKAKFEALIQAKLREGGFTAVPSQEVDALWKRMKEQLGGFFDPITGKRDEAKFKTAREHLLREVSATTKADAILHPAIQLVKVNFGNSQARWHGTSESLITGGFWGAFLAGANNGTTSALSLFVTLEDVNGVELYVNAGGIQLAAKLSGQRFAAVPRNELFADEKRNLAAVNVALNPLIGKTAPPEPGASPTPERENQ